MFTWRIVDMVIASVLGAASGVLCWVWGLAATGMIYPVTAFFMPLQSLAEGGWIFAGVLGGIIIRKPAAALFTEVVAATVSMMLGSQWGFQALLWAIMQGLGAEIIFALFLYKKWNLWVSALAGMGAAVGGAVLYQTMIYVAWATQWRLVSLGCAILSGVLIAGIGSWWLAKALAQTGVLDQFASGREMKDHG